ncbi:MAG: exopolysaccharide biosynthesis polyprenyl glycosylphosphotransferase [Candidatus Aminicenantes bacterium]|nr:exopolysaccharide biosynthesis polyprenyl glycosylphosphotransferase [Candidatus Aminicenantes bacterium]
MAFDFVLLLLSLRVTFILRYRVLEGPLPIPKLVFVVYVLLLLPYAFIFRLNNLYKQRIFLSSYEQMLQIVKSLLSLLGLYILAVFGLRNLLIEKSRVLLILFFIIAFFFLALGRVFVFRKLYKIFKGNEALDLKRRIIVVGAGQAGTDLLTKIKESPYEGIKILGFFDDDPAKKGKEILGVPVLGAIQDMDYYLQTLKISVDGIYICISLIDHQALLDLIQRIKAYGYPVYLDSQPFKVINDRINVHEFESLLSASVHGASNAFYTDFLKRIMDAVFSALFLLLLSPFFLVVSVLIKMTSKGTVIYKSRVVGKNEKQFTWYKFRTMRVGQDSAKHDTLMYELIKKKKKEGTLKIKDDERITRVGKFLRKFSLDELPQLVNVLKGQMSLIGPRPCSPYEFSLYEEWHKKRFAVLPGITGLWQAFGRSYVGYDDMIIMDVYYIEKMSFWLDLKILFKTAEVVLLGKGAY